MTNIQKPLRGALVGYGFIQSKGHVPAYLEREDVEIVAVADVCDARRCLVPQLLPQAQIYTDYEIMLEEQAGHLDFIDIATPPCFHTEIAIAAMEKGIHVLCEKPLTTSLEEATLLVNKARQTETVLFPCHNYKHAPVVKAIQEIIQSGKIGRVTSLTLNTYRNTHAKGVTEWKTHWRRDHRYSGGGIAMDHGSHTLYLTFDWLGNYPTAITAKMDNLQKETYDTEDNFTAVLTYPNGLAHVHLTWTAGVRKVIYTIQGEKGAIRVEDDDLELATMHHTEDQPDVAQGAVTWHKERHSISSHWMDASHVQWFNSLFDQFRNAIQEKNYVSLETKEAYFCIQAIMKAYESAHEQSREITLLTELP